MIFFNHWLFRNYLQVYYLLSSIYNIHKIFWAVISSILTWKIIINEMWKQVLKTDKADHLPQKVDIQSNLFIPMLQSGCSEIQLTSIYAGNSGYKRCMHVKYELRFQWNLNGFCFYLPFLTNTVAKHISVKLLKHN